MYRGQMDSWQPDDALCQGSCGQCDDCENSFYQACDDAYDAFRDEES